MGDLFDDPGRDLGTIGRGSMTAMEPTASELEATASPGVSPEGHGRGWRLGANAVDLSFLVPSPRIGSLGRIGEYEIFGVLGRGAMGIVLRGYDRALDRPVAVKVQDPSLALNRRARARFLHEARVAAAINHPNVVTIYKVTVVRDRPYLAMEFVAGTLGERIRGTDPLEIGDVLRIALRVAQGLAAAHEQGVLHRDIKPANILMEEGPDRVKISDFGLALGRLGAGGAVRPGRVVGTPAYMSPEQVRGHRLDARSDLFSLGCVLYAMLAGRSPFASANPFESVRLVCELEPPPPPEADHPASRPLNALIMRLLEKAPEDRPGSAGEVAAVLKALVAEADQLASGEVLVIPDCPAPETDPKPVVGPEPAPATLGRWDGATASVAALAAITLLGAVLWLRSFVGAYVGPGPDDGRPPLHPQRTTQNTHTVGRSGPSDYPDLASALKQVGPGATLILVDPGKYDGAIVLDDPVRHRDLTIEGHPRLGLAATLVASGGSAVVTIQGVPGVTLRNLTVSTRVSQFAVSIAGQVEGVWIDGVRHVSPAESSWTQIYLHDGASGTPERPIVVSGSTFEVGHGGVTMGEPGEAAVSHVAILGNRFFGPDEHVHVLQATHDVKITGNIFVGGQPLTLNLDRERAHDIVIANNTFFRAERWLHPCDSAPELEGVVVCNNAILESAEIEVGDHELERRFRGRWVFHHNLWEPGTGAPEPPISTIVDYRSHLAVLSRDERHPDFLRPPLGSALARTHAGAGGGLPDYIGALAPVALGPPGSTQATAWK